ncbi:MAG: Tim44 domain-containing protein [Gammaproteobacteria bacterium]|nr:Tim44 domain-containing protein [Gammaproteobacteria bacterium]
MNKKLLIILISIISFTFIIAGIAEAKRFGGGSSFGSKRSYSSPFKQKSSQQKSFSQQKAASTNQQRKQQMSKRGGLMGMLGGLALGGLLGALFFGGAFENFNFFDIFIIGGIIWAIWWFMKRKALPSQARAASTSNSAYDFDINSQSGNKPESQFKLNTNKGDSSFSENFSTTKDTSASSSSSPKKDETSFAESFGMNSGQNHSSAQADNEVILPEWFNQDEFLDGARSAYTQLQEAWDNADMDSIKGLTTSSVFEEISQQLASDSAQGNTRILKLNAELIDFSELEEHTEASVLFDALLDESDDSNQGRATQVKELWHFVRGRNSTEPTWYLDGLQQLD